MVDLEDSDCEDEVLPAKRSRTSPDEAGPSRATRVRIFPILELKNGSSDGSTSAVFVCHKTRPAPAGPHRCGVPVYHLKTLCLNDQLPAKRSRALPDEAGPAISLENAA